MKGSDYVAVTRITTREGKVLAAVDASCESVPVSALPWLLEGGDIKPKPRAKAAAHEPTEGGE